MQPVPGPYRPPTPGPFRPAPPPATVEPATAEATVKPAAAEATVDGDGTGHPAVDAVVQALANAADLPPRDQIAEYEAAHSTLQETLATIDQA
ncbi:hypothetical protein [Phytohabitans houttuyneae]|jgi:hypothetical protein|uniref:Uncharacterized protein n=1 Tax=Phytohabitans houttuyneae TaxID=1076126 RepID=A0A6V8JYZ5_9ACTN|nr:hypothetical protein [Phytohabitans houttuyneae]GFJ76504.1 hypothetical protein Phou_006840 [Phytohabitans houttuyneae]